MSSHKVCFSLLLKAIIKTLGIQSNRRKSCRFKRSIKNIISINSHFNNHLGLPVVHERSGVVTMKSINIYILHDSSLVVYSVFCVKLSDPACLRSGLRVKCVALPAVSFQLVPTEVAGHIGIGRDRVLVFGLSGVMIQINVIDVHIGHESSVGVCFAKRLRIYQIGKTPWLASCLSAKR